MLNKKSIIDLDIADQAKQLLEESLICYNNSIYRGAFLLAYLAFKVSIKYRLLTGKKPDEVNEANWKTITDELNDDNKWEDKINEIVNASAKFGNGNAAIFKFNDYERIKNRYQYWRDIRNSCVHAKTEMFTESLVSYFYDYLLQDLPYYYVLGGKQHILDVINDEFTYNNLNTDDEINKTLNECKIIYKGDLDTFIYDFFDGKNIDVYFFENKIVKSFLKDKDYRDACAKYISTDLSNIYTDYIWFNADIRLVEEVYNLNKKEFKKHIIPNIMGFSSGFILEYDIIIRIIYIVLKDPDNVISIDSLPIYNNLLIAKQVIDKKDETIIDFFRQKKVFNYFLEKGGNYYFLTYANQLYKQYCNFDTEDKVEPLFDYIVWDKGIVEKLDAAANLSNVLENKNSIANRDRRKDSIKKIYNKHKSIIDEIASKENIEIKHLAELKD